MNFPVGEIIGKGSAPFDLVARAKELEDSRFSGYLILAVKGNFIEEGALFFRDGALTACIVECLAVDALIKGSAALEFFANESKGTGFFQVVSLTRSQVDLVVAFDERLSLGKVDLKDLTKIVPAFFSPRFSIPVDERNALDSYGLGSLK